MTDSRTLVVMRHAKSSWKTNEPDALRPLSPRGTRDAVVAGQTLARAPFDVVLCSPALRARQTWQCLGLGGAASGDVRVLDSLYGASSDTVLAELNALDESVHHVLLVNHEPTVSDLVLRLARPNPLTQQVDARFPTAGIATLRFEGPWPSLVDQAATLLTFRAPRG